MNDILDDKLLSKIDKKNYSKIPIFDRENFKGKI